MPYTGGAIRVGISGAPGVGKSTFIEALGNYVIDQGLKVAVLTVDPSSAISGGSILGDKTRMETLARREEAFIRPSPSGTTLGGVTRRSRETLLLWEAAGFDVIIVETVGVGQSETRVAEMTDTFVLLVQPGAGDNLQGIKRGIMELADLILVNQADDGREDMARRSASEYEHALQLLRARSKNWKVEVRTCSARDNVGIDSAWDAIIRHRAALEASEELAVMRARQAGEDPGRTASDAADRDRPFRILGIQQIAVGGLDKDRLRTLWVDTLGLTLGGNYTSEKENVDEDIAFLGEGPHRVEVDLMQPIDPEKAPRVHSPPLNHVGLWVDDLPAAVEWLTAQGMRFAPGGIRKGASGHDICFVHPKGNEDKPIGGEGVLIELVQAPPEVIEELA
jgi:LAO/AO transport system kinase